MNSRLRHPARHSYLPAINLRRAVIVIAAVIGIWLLAWVAARLLITDAPLNQADAIVVLSGAAVIKERARWAGKLYKEGRARRIILTNDNQQESWSRAEQRNPFYYERAVRTLTSVGVPREAIEVLPQPVSNTYEEAMLLRHFAQEQQLHSLLVVTSAYHSRRALWILRDTFVSSGIDIGLMAVPPGDESPRPATWWLYAQGWQSVAGEYLKMVNYLLGFQSSRTPAVI